MDNDEADDGEAINSADEASLEHAFHREYGGDYRQWGAYVPNANLGQDEHPNPDDYSLIDSDLYPTPGKQRRKYYNGTEVYQLVDDIEAGKEGELTEDMVSKMPGDDKSHKYFDNRQKDSAHDMLKSMAKEIETCIGYKTKEPESDEKFVDSCSEEAAAAMAVEAKKDETLSAKHPAVAEYFEREPDLVADYDAIGFSVEHVLARFNVQELTRHLISVHIQELTSSFDGYPEEFKDAEEISEHLLLCAQGPVVWDIERGTILRLGVDKVVTQAVLGFEQLSIERIKDIYGCPPRFRALDWPRKTRQVEEGHQPYEVIAGPTEAFKIPIICNFVDMAIRNIIKQTEKSYLQFAFELHEVSCRLLERRAEEKEPRRGLFYPEIYEQKSDYVLEQPKLRDMLELLRSEKKVLFIVSNLDACYVEMLMHETLGEDWQNLFDVIAVSSRKPLFQTAHTPFAIMNRGLTPIKLTWATKIYRGGNMQELNDYIKDLTRKKHVKVAYIGSSYGRDIMTTAKFDEEQLERDLDLEKSQWDTIAVVNNLCQEPLEECLIPHSDDYYGEHFYKTVKKEAGEDGEDETIIDYFYDKMASAAVYAVPFVTDLAQLVLNRATGLKMDGGDEDVKETDQFLVEHHPGNLIILQPKSRHRFTLIWLHGLGDTALGFKDVFLNKSMCALPEGCRVILPTAPSTKVTVNDAQLMPAWYDITSFEQPDAEADLTDAFFERTYNQAQIRASVELLKKLIHGELRTLGSSQQIFIGGFSQGCSISLATLLEFKGLLGGMAGCSGIHCTNIDWTQVNLSEKNKTAILLYHGEADPLFSLNYAKYSLSLLQQRGLTNVQFETEKGLEHSFSISEMRRLSAFFKEHMTADKVLVRQPESNIQKKLISGADELNATKNPADVETDGKELTYAQQVKAKRTELEALGLADPATRGNDISFLDAISPIATPKEGQSGEIDQEPWREIAAGQGINPDDIFRDDGDENQEQQYSTVQSRYQVRLEHLTLKMVRAKIITQKGVDAIVCPAEPDLTHKKGLARLIADSAGPSVEKESKQYLKLNGDLLVGECIATSGGKLHARHIIFTVVGLNEEFAGTVDSILQKADKLQCTSISLPPLGTGDAATAQALVSAVMNYRPKTLKVVNFTDESDVFQNEFDRRYDEWRERAEPVRKKRPSIDLREPDFSALNRTIEKPENIFSDEQIDKMLAFHKEDYAKTIEKMQDIEKLDPQKFMNMTDLSLEAIQTNMTGSEKMTTAEMDKLYKGREEDGVPSLAEIEKMADEAGVNLEEEAPTAAAALEKPTKRQRLDMSDHEKVQEKQTTPVRRISFHNETKDAKEGNNAEDESKDFPSDADQPFLNHASSFSKIYGGTEDTDDTKIQTVDDVKHGFDWVNKSRSVEWQAYWKKLDERMKVNAENPIHSRQTYEFPTEKYDRELGGSHKNTKKDDEALHTSQLKMEKKLARLREQQANLEKESLADLQVKEKKIKETKQKSSPGTVKEDDKSTEIKKEVESPNVDSPPTQTANVLPLKRAINSPLSDLPQLDVETEEEKASKSSHSPRSWERADDSFAEEIRADDPKKDPPQLVSDMTNDEEEIEKPPIHREPALLRKIGLDKDEDEDDKIKEEQKKKMVTEFREELTKAGAKEQELEQGTADIRALEEAEVATQWREELRKAGATEQDLADEVEVASDNEEVIGEPPAKKFRRTRELIQDPEPDNIALIDMEVGKEDSPNLQRKQRLLYRGGLRKKPTINYNYLRLYSHNLCPYSAQARYILSYFGHEFQEMCMECENMSQWHDHISSGVLPILETQDGQQFTSLAKIYQYAVKNSADEDRDLEPDDPLVSVKLTVKLQDFDALHDAFDELWCSKGTDKLAVQKWIRDQLPNHEKLAKDSKSSWLMDTKHPTILDFTVGPVWELLFLLEGGPNKTLYSALDLKKNAPALYAYVSHFREFSAVRPHRILKEISDNYWTRALRQNGEVRLSVKDYNKVIDADTEQKESVEKKQLSPLTQIRDEITSNPLVVFGRKYWAGFEETRQLIAKKGIDARIIDMSYSEGDGVELYYALVEMTGSNDLPQIFIDGRYFGGNERFQQAALDGTLSALLKEHGVANSIGTNRDYGVPRAPKSVEQLIGEMDNKKDATQKLPEQLIKENIEREDVLIFGRKYTASSDPTRQLLREKKIKAKYIALDTYHNGPALLDALEERTQEFMLPQIFIKGQYFGGKEEFARAATNGTLAEVLTDSGISHGLEPAKGQWRTLSTEKQVK